MKTLLISYVRLLTFLAYGISLLASAKVLAFSGFAINTENHKPASKCSSMASNSNPAALHKSHDAGDDNISGKVNFCIISCKYLPGFTLQGFEQKALPSQVFHWKFHYQSPHGEILSDPPRM